MTRHLAPNLILFYVIAFAFAWAFWMPLALAESGYLTLPTSLYTYLSENNPGAWGPLIAAIVTALIASGWTGLRDLFRRMTRVKFGLRWYVISLALIPAIIWLSGWIAQLRGAELPVSEVFENPIAIPVSFIWIFFLGGPLQEEAGWRGTATHTLQKGRMGALGASIIVGLLWGLWHAPLFYIPREEIYYNQPVWGLLGSTVLLAVLLTWVYNNTGQSLFAVMLMHTSFNWANYIFTTLEDDIGGQTYFFLMVTVVLLVVVLFGPSRLSRNANPD